MLARKDESIKEAVTTIYQLSQEEQIRLQCEAREDYYRRQRTVQHHLDMQKDTIESQNATIEKQNVTIQNQNAVIENQNSTIRQLTAQAVSQEEEITSLKNISSSQQKELISMREEIESLKKLLSGTL